MNGKTVIQSGHRERDEMARWLKFRYELENPPWLEVIGSFAMVGGLAFIANCLIGLFR